MKSLEIRSLDLAQLEIVLKWAEVEGWNPGIQDAKTFKSAVPSGFFGGFRDGELVASISVAKYSQDFAFIGLFIVVPQLRRQGLSQGLINKVLEITDGVTTGIDGVVAMQQTYSKYGFNFAHRNYRFEGNLPLPYEYEDRCIRIETSQDVQELDLECFGTNRDTFLESWIKQEDSFTLFSELGKGKRGFTTVRKCKDGHKIGPLFADTQEVAYALLSGIAHRLGPTNKVSIDVPEPNGNAIGIVRSLGLFPTFETARMYSGDWKLPLNKVFGITSLELG